jgi:hypothetical protein
VTSLKAIEYFNNGKKRIRIIKDDLWLIEDFFSYQYGHVFNINNRVHESIDSELKRNKIKLDSIRGITDYQMEKKKK